MVYLYILQSLKDKGFYIGICKDLSVRIKKHNNGSVPSTKNRLPFQVIYTETYLNYADARKREIEIKAYKGGIKFKELIKHCRII